MTASETRHPDLAIQRFVTRHYEMLQGLAVVPLLLAIPAVLLAPVQGWALVLLALVGSGLGLLAAGRISRAYRRRFGQVTPVHRPGLGLVAATAAVGVPVVAVQLLTHRYALLPVLPISPEGLIIGLALLVGAWRLRPLAVPFGLLAGVGLVTSLIPVPGGHPWSDPKVLLVACCAGAVVLALASHRLLLRTLR